MSKARKLTVSRLGVRSWLRVVVFGGGQVGRKLGMGLSLGWLERLDVR